MIRRYGSDRVYRTTYLSGVQWQRDRRSASPLARVISGVAGALKGAVRFAYGAVFVAVTAVAGLFRRDGASGRRRAVRAELTVDREPISIRGYTSRHRGRLAFFPNSLASVARAGLVCLAAIVLLTAIAAAPSAAVLASSATVMLLDEEEGIAYQITTQAATVGELMDSYDFNLSVGDIVYPDRTQPLKDGQEIYLRRAMNVSASADGIDRELRIQAGTVREALAMSGIRYSPGDIIKPSLNTQLTPGMEISVTRVTEETLTESRRLYYYEKRQKDATLYIGEEKIAQQGKEGEKEVDIRIVYHDGEEAFREEVAERVLSAPEHRIIKEGTKEKPVAVKASSSSTKGSKSTSTTSAQSASSSRYEQSGYSENKYWVFYGDKQYEKGEALSVRATAYTHTGRPTASGAWPSIGTIAVDKSVIPMGTRIYVPGYGIGIAQDTGSAIKGNKIDVFLNTEQECVQWGVKSVTIYILGKPQPRGQ